MLIKTLIIVVDFTCVQDVRALRTAMVLCRFSESASDRVDKLNLNKFFNRSAISFSKTAPGAAFDLVFVSCNLMDETQYVSIAETSPFPIILLVIS